MTRLALDIHRYRLAAGPRVVLSPDRSASTVAVCLTFPNQALRVSAEDSWKVRLLQTGWPHSLAAATREQLGWRALGEERDLASDFVSYTGLFPAHDLEFGIWAMAEQTRNAAFGALPELYRNLALDDEAPRLFTRTRVIDWFSAGSPPWEGPGAPEPLSGPVLEALRGLAVNFWRLDDAVLSLSGAFEREQAEAFIARHFQGRVASDDAPEPVQSVREPKSPKSGRVAWSSEPSAVFFGFAIPAVDHPDHAGLRMLARILGGMGLGRGIGGTLRPMVASTGGTKGSDMLVVEVPIVSATEVGGVERRLQALLANLAKIPPRPHAMKRALERERQAFWARFETPQNRALTLARSEARSGDARHALRDLAELERVRAQDVSRVAGVHLVPQKPGVLVQMHEGGP